MDVLVSYDVATGDAVGRRRLRKVAKVCVGYGQRVQKSVFECSVNELQMEELRDRLVKCIDEKKDSLRIYRLVEPREKHVESFGRDAYVDFDGPLVV
jgi:CRISPR-associated protein Cas2